MDLSNLELETSFIKSPIPASSSTSVKSLLILVHGRGGKWKLMEWLSKRFKIGGLDYLCIQAPFPEDVPEMKEPGFSWWFMPGHRGIDESRQKIRNLEEALFEAAYSSQNIVWLGFSQGGMLCVDTVLRSDFAFAGCICVSGLVTQIDSYPEAFGSKISQQRILATHGPRDALVDFERSKKSFGKLQELGVSVEFKEYDKPHSFDLKNEIPYLESKLKIWLDK